MKIGIFETEHFEVTYPVIRFFDNGENDITIFIYEKSYTHLRHMLKADMDKYTWVIKGEHQSKYRFMYRLYTGIRKRNIELLYFNTVPDNFILYAFIIRMYKHVRIVMTIHNINSMFEWKPALSLKRWVRIAGKKWLTGNLREYNVISVTMVNYLKSRLPPHKKVHCIPGGMFEGPASILEMPPLQPLIRIVVPGTVDNRRRNYEIVFDLLEECNRIELPVHITLLGGFSDTNGLHVHEQCEAYARRHQNLTFYGFELVDQPTFDKAMRSAHLVLAPSVINTVLFDDIEEVYGLSTCSGNIFDIVKHAKPFLLPAGVSVEEALENSCLRYREVDDIIRHLLTLHNSPAAYLLLQEKALQASLNYRIEKVRERNRDLFIPKT